MDTEVLNGEEIVYEDNKIPLAELAPDIAVLFNMCVSDVTITETLGKGFDFSD